jgi:hypothetical protein
VADPQLVAWRLARSGQWVKLERVLRASADARDFIRHLPYQMYFEGYERAEHMARELDAQDAARRAGQGELPGSGIDRDRRRGPAPRR